jgi:DNA-binding MarR family transcriptional regulator
MDDHLDKVIAQWNAEKPGLDVSPMAVVGRLSRAAAAIDARVDRTLADHDLDPATFDVLATLLRSGPPYRISPLELSRTAMITTSAVAQRLNKLEHRGLVSRKPNPADGRSTLVELTAAGRAIVEAALPHHLDTERNIVGALTPLEQAQLAALLEKIYHSAVGRDL